MFRHVWGISRKPFVCYSLIEVRYISDIFERHILSAYLSDLRFCPGGGGEGSVTTMPRCVSGETWMTWVLFWYRVSEMREKISLKMGAKVAASFNS